MTVDVHSHFWPAGVLKAARDERDWYGWQATRRRDGALALSLGDREVVFPAPQIDLADPEARAESRARRSVRMEVAMPVGFLWNQHLNGSAASAHCREINEELLGAERESASALIALGSLPFHAPKHFEGELQYLVENGIRGVAVPASVRSKNLDDPEVLPLVELAAEAGVVMVLHPTYLDPPGADRLERYYLSNTVGASLECTVGLMSLIHSGIFDRHDDLQLVVVQGGGSVPYEIGRFNLRYQERDDVRSMIAPPHEYLRRVHYDCMVADDDSLAFLIERVGADRVLLGTDYPFRSDVPQGAVRWVSEHAGLAPHEKQAILEDNAVELFGLTPQVRPT